MAYKIFRKGGYFYIVDTVTRRERDGLTSGVRVTRGTTIADTFYVNGVNDWSNSTAIPIADIQKEDGTSYTLTQFIEFYQSANSQDVNLQDQHTPAIIAKFSVLEEETTLTSTVAIDDLTMTVDDATGFTVGKYVSIFSVADNRFYLGNVVSASGNPVSLDTPIDFAYPSGSNVTAGTTNMAVDGSSTPMIFGLRNTIEAIGATADITRLIFTCLAETPIDLSKFGDLAALVNGIVLRRVDGTYKNIFNVKTNQEIAGLMYDFNPQAATNPAQGQDGFVSRLTFAGQNKIGVTLRLSPGEDLQLIVQDDLETAQAAAQISSLEIIAEGHIVE